MRSLIVVVILLIVSIACNIYQYGDRTELSLAVDTAVEANDKWERQLALKQDEVDGIAFQCQVVGEELERQSRENAKLKEDADNAKLQLKKKDIVGNFNRWIEDDPSGFSIRATAESNRVLSNIVKISEGSRSTSSDTGSKENTLQDIGNAKNTGT